ncbi:MAG: fibronectin type III domain-containing protein [Aeromicrobium sp.]
MDAVRPALILFTDGKHDVPGVPVSQVEPTRDRLFGSRSPFALLPVGMGLSPTDRGALEAGLLRLRIIRDMPACTSGARFDWPQVVFESADDAGNAVAVALQDATCTFTVAPEATSSPSPTPAAVPTPTAVRAVELTPGDGRVSVTWIAPAATPVPIVDYRVRCRSSGGDWIESGEGASLETSAVVEGLTNGSPYECEVASVGATSDGPWTAAPASVTPTGPPATPGRPAVAALDRAVRIVVPAQGAPLVSDYRYECSGDQGRTWPFGIDVLATGTTTAEIGNLTNGVEYVCRAYAANAAGLSDPSEVSDAVRPCGSLLECNPGATPIVGILGFVGVGGLLVALFTLYRSRTRGYVVAVVDVVHTANLGHGSRLGIGFVRARPGGPITGIVADGSRDAELRIRHRRGDRFEVTDRRGRHIAISGERIVAIDSRGVQHAVVLRRFSGSTASDASGGK